MAEDEKAKMAADDSVRRGEAIASARLDQTSAIDQAIAPSDRAATHHERPSLKSKIVTP